MTPTEFVEALRFTDTNIDYTDDEADEAAANMPLPVAVYGTLRPGHGNSSLWRGRASAEEGCYVENFRLIGRGFPYAIPTEGAVSAVTLIHPHPDFYADVLDRMDMLEGVPHHYTRETVAVHTTEGVVVAFMYVPANHDRTYTGASVVPLNAAGHHDWNERVR